jgi:ERCC4-type nuclease
LERKSIPDLVSWLTAERERAERNKERLLAYACRGLIIEGSWADIEAGNWRSKVSGRSIAQSLLSWISQGLPVLLPGDREKAADVTARIIYLTARRQYRIARAMVEGLAVEQEVAQ